MARPVPPEAWAQILQQGGPEQAAQWAAESGYDAPEDVDDGQELPAIDGIQPPVYQASPLEVAASGSSIPGAAPQGGLDALLERRRQSVAEMYDAAAKQLQESYRGPSTSDMLLALGAGLLQPTNSGSFTEALGQGLQSMLPYLKEKHSGRNQLNMELAKLNMGKAKDIGDLEEKYLVAQMKGTDPGKPVWSESLKRFVSRGEGVVIEAGSLPDGRRTEKLSDGNIRVYDSPNTFTIHDPGGRVIGQGTR